ncbi:MAG: hypothetical protein ACKO2G_13745 [Verrucomicrobiales bacterium]
MNRRHLNHILLALALAPFVGAQEDPPSREIALRIACFRFVDGVNTASFQAAEGQGFLAIPFFQGGFTSPKKIKIKGNSIDFLQQKPGDDGEITLKKIAGATIAEDTREASILLLPAPAGSDLVYNAVVMPGERDFPFGHVLMMNLTATDMKIAIGQKVVELPGKQVKITDPKPSIDEFNMYPVAIAYQMADSTEWVTMHTTRWQWNERVRQIAIAWFDDQNQKPEVSTMRDIQEVVAPAPNP